VKNRQLKKENKIERYAGEAFCNEKYCLATFRRKMKPFWLCAMKCIECTGLVGEERNVLSAYWDLGDVRSVCCIVRNNTYKHTQHESEQMKLANIICHKSLSCIALLLVVKMSQ
jgi:hypothetical protein